MGSSLHLGSDNLNERLSKSETLEKIGFEATVTRGVQAVFKKEDEFLIWGPASVEIVDKEGDKISVEALDKALPQLLKRARLSLEHTDQIVGRILERFETAEPVTVEINGEQYERSEFPTEVLDLDDGSPAALYVAGEVFNDTQQSKRARDEIESGELTSYSISGEALVTRKKVEQDTVYDDIVDLDLSAVTLCEEGMNQGAGYAKVEGEVSDKELAGESADDDVEKHRQEVPVLQHPSLDSAGAETATVTKNMSDNESESEEKSEEESSSGPTLEDVAKRLPEDGEIATKTDVNEAKSEAVEAFKEEALPEGDLATVKYVEELVDQRVEEKLDAAQAEKEFSDTVLELADEHDISPEKAAEILEAAEDEEDEEDYEEDEEKAEDEDDEDEDDEEKAEDEDDEEDDEEEKGDYEDDDDEEDEKEGDMVDVSMLQEELPDDVWQVVAEYLDADGGEMEASASDGDGVDPDVAKEVEKVLNGDVSGGSAIPVGDDEDQVDKQYNPEAGEGEQTADRSPALAHWE